MNTKRKSQHFVPKFYLRNFSYFLNEKQIGLYNTRNKFYFQTASIKSQGARDFFYGADGVLENNLCSIEGHLSSTIRKILESPTVVLSDDEYYDLLFFVVLTNSRNPTKISGFRQTIVKMRETLVAEAPNTDIDQIVPIPSHEDCVKLSLQNCANLIEGIRDLKYVFFENTTNTPFICSDNPVVKYNQYLEWKRWPHARVGYASIGLQIFVPLSPTKMIFLFDSNCYTIACSKPDTYVVNSSDDVYELNLLQFVNCIDTVYFNEEVEKSYITDLHECSNQFSKGNVPFSTPAYVYQREVKSNVNDRNTAAKNLLINGVTACGTNLRIRGLKISPSAKNRRLDNRIAQPRPGSMMWKRIVSDV